MSCLHSAGSLEQFRASGASLLEPGLGLGLSGVGTPLGDPEAGSKGGGDVAFDAQTSSLLSPVSREERSGFSECPDTSHCNHTTTGP